MKAEKVDKYVVSGCKDRKEAVAFLQEICGPDTKLDVIESQKVAGEGWSYKIDAIQEVAKQEKKGESKKKN